MANFIMAALALAIPAAVDSYTWNLNYNPTQCGNVSITVAGGSPPYQVLVVPYGSSPLPNNIEARKIQDEGPFQSANISFKINYPHNSQFVAVVSDSSGFASGGTSVGVLVITSGDASCFDASQNVKPQFVYSIVPDGVIAQCSPTRLWWDPSAGVQGTPRFHGVIPGGDSFEIPQGSITQVPEQGTGFSWTPPLRGMSTFLLVAGDNRGNGTGGSTLYIVGSGANNDNSCLKSDSPTSTVGNPAGGSYQTGTNGGNSGGGGGGGGGGGITNNSREDTHYGAIVGGTVGGVVFVVAMGVVAFLLVRRRRMNRKEQFRPDLLTAEGDEGDDHTGAPRNELPQFYQPKPFIVADPAGNRSSVDGLTADGRTDSQGRPISIVASDDTRSGTPDPSMIMSGRTGKSAPMQQLRPVNIVELPPAYTNIRKDLTSRSQAEIAAAAPASHPETPTTATATQPPAS
ncbi:hypothetical protein R3P38DRAFT_3345796 [Favolaschia claudopus]|uniref:receptor protein-tyrosine kinase n=1 Tax=Favolaschia claudopus TaxID=2862362 RepID=A0AAW0DC95_9AGAR